jgi:hypothetical protein
MRKLLLNKNICKDVLYAFTIGDIIGFNNGYYEFFEYDTIVNNSNLKTITNIHDNILLDFNRNGSFDSFDIDCKKRIASDDSILNIFIFHSLLKSK